jgi:hypothetical protein
MKTAVSVPDEIFKEVEEFSKVHRYSRSKIFAIAVKEFLERRKSWELFNTLNQAYSEPESSGEGLLRAKSKRYYAKRVLKGDDTNQTR